MEPQWTHCYRMRPYYRNLAVVCTIAFAVMGGVSTASAYFNVDGSFPNPGHAAWIFGVFWSAWVVLGIWLLLVYCRYRLFRNATSLCQVGLVRERNAQLDLVQELRWRRFPAGGSVRLAGPFGVVKIELANFNSAERTQLISYLRGAVDLSRQTGWQAFYRQFEDPEAKRERARRDQRVGGVVCLAFAVGFLAAWIAGLGVINLPASIVTGAVGGWRLRNYLSTCPLKENESCDCH